MRLDLAWLALLPGLAVACALATGGTTPDSTGAGASSTSASGSSMAGGGTLFTSGSGGAPATSGSTGGAPASSSVAASSVAASSVAASSVAASSAASSSSGAVTCDQTTGTCNTCKTCADTGTCKASFNACNGEMGSKNCHELLACVGNCGDALCVQGCEAAAMTPKYAPYKACLCAECLSNCSINGRCP